jgi:hypothetical protein
VNNTQRTQSSTPDDVAAVRSMLGAADPVPDPTVAMEEVLAARASVGRARAATTPARPPGRRGIVAAGAVAVLSVAALVALVAVPAGNDGDTVALATGPGARAVSSAYAATAGTGTARGLVTVTQGGRTVTATGVGAFESGAARADITVGGGGGAAAAELTVVRTGDAIFVKLPAGATPLGAGKPWVSVDAATLTRLTQMALGDISAQVTGAPLDALAYLKAVAGDVQVVGPDTVRGEATTHLRAKIDARKVAEQLPASLRPEAAKAAGQVGQDLPTELWIDGQGRLRKMVLTADVTQVEGAPVAPGSGPAILTVELWDFGAPLDATAPPADQVVDVGGLLGGFLDGARTP